MRSTSRPLSPPPAGMFISATRRDFSRPVLIVCDVRCRSDSLLAVSVTQSWGVLQRPPPPPSPPPPGMKPVWEPGAL